MQLKHKLNLHSYLAYILIPGLPFYYFINQKISASISTYVYGSLLILLFLLSFYQNILREFRHGFPINKLFIIEILILLNIILVLAYIGILEKNLMLVFVTLYISKNIFAVNADLGFINASNIITLSAFFCSIGVFLGVIEAFFFSSHWFNQVMDFDYPYSNGISETILINGFFPSANGSAYSLGAGLAFMKFQNIFNYNLRKVLYILFIITLIATKAKFAVLVAATYLGFMMFQKSAYKLLICYLCILALFYLMLSHIIIAIPGTYDYPSLHFRKILFSNGYVDFIIGNYGIFKLYSFEAMTSNIFIPFGLNRFIEIYSGRPHFMLGGLIISGGISLACLIVSYIYFLLKKPLVIPILNSRSHALFLSILFCFMVETFNWNFTNSFYFWGMIMAVQSLKDY